MQLPNIADLLQFLRGDDRPVGEICYLGTKMHYFKIKRGNINCCLSFGKTNWERSTEFRNPGENSEELCLHNLFCSVLFLASHKKKKKLRKNKTKIRPRSLSCLVWAQKNICREQGARSAGHRFTLTMSQHQQRNLDIRLCFYLKIQMPLSSFSTYNPLPEHSMKYMSIYITYEQKY